MQGASSGGVAGEEERSAGPGWAGHPPPQSAWRAAGPCGPHAHTWLGGSERETWSCGGSRRKGRRKGLDFLTVQTLRMCWSWEGHGLGCPHIGCPQQRSRDAPWSWGSPSTVLAVATPAQQQQCGASQHEGKHFGEKKQSCHQKGAHFNSPYGTVRPSGHLGTSRRARPTLLPSQRV